MRRLDTIINRARREAANEDYSATEGISQTQLVEYANEAQDRIQTLVSAVYAEFLKTTDEFNTVVGQEDYQIADSRLYLNNRVSLVEFSSTGLDKDFLPMRRGEIYNRDETQGQPSRYIRENDVIKLNPIPNSTTYKVRITFEKEADDLDIRRARIASTSGPVAEVTDLTFVGQGVGEQHRIRFERPNFGEVTTGDYYTFSTPVTDYYLWINLDDGGGDPALPGRTGIELTCTSAETNTIIRDRALTLMASYPEFSPVTSVSTHTMDLTNITVGNVTDISGSAGIPGSYYSTLVQGSESPAYGALLSTGDYFLINSTDTEYYVWFNIDSGGGDPSISGKTGVEVAITSSDSVGTVTQAVETALGTVSDFTISVVADDIRVTNDTAGLTTDADDGTVGTNMTIDIQIQGTEITAFNLESTLPAPDPDIDNIDVGDYVCVVNKDGDVCALNIPVTSGDTTTPIINIPNHVLSAGEAIAIGCYVVFGQYTTTHSELPDAFETYIREYVTWKILEQDGVTEFSRRHERRLIDKENSLVNAYASLGRELIEIPVLDDHFTDDFGL